MALFKILKGNEADLPSEKHEGWAYVTEKGNMYVDLSNDTRVKVGNRADTAEFADKATGDTKSIRDIYLAKLAQVESTGSKFTFRGITGGGDNAPDLISIPLAGDLAGLVSNAAQTIKGNKTFFDGISFPTIGTWPAVAGETYPIKSKGLNWSGSSDNGSIFYEVQATDKGMIIIQSGDDTGAGTIFRNSSSGNEVSIINGLVTGTFQGNLTGTASHATSDANGNNIAATYVADVSKKKNSDGSIASHYVFRVTKGDGTYNDVDLHFAASASCGGAANSALTVGQGNDPNTAFDANAITVAQSKKTFYATNTDKMTNRPSGTHWGYLDAGAYSSSYMTQTFTDGTNANTYIRVKNNTWGDWKQFAFTDGTIQNAQYAEKDKEGNIIADSYVSTIVQDSSTGTAFSFKGVSANGDARPDIISIPAATATVAGLVTNAAQTFAGVKTFKNNIDVKGKVIIDLNGNKVEIGSDNKSYFHFLVRSQATTPLTFWFGGPIQTAGGITPYGHNTYDLGSSGSRWKTGYFGSGGINVSGTITDKESNELKASLFVNTLIASTSSGNSFIIGGKNTAGDEITTLAIPNASATSVGLVTNEAQTFGGHKTFNNNVYGDFRSLMADAVGGHLLYTDPTFMIGSNSVVVYNNASNGNVVHERITRPSDCPSVSDYVIKITTKGTASPGYGGFYQTLTSRAGAQFVIKYLIKLPVGYKLVTATNSMGSGYVDKIISDNAGTGQWKIYTRYVKCGTSGSFSNGGHLYVANNGGAAPSASAPLVWYLGGIWAYDITRTGINSDINHIYPNFDSQQLTIHGKLKVEDKIFDSAGSEIKASLFVNTIAQNAISGTAYSIKGVNTEGDSITTLSLPIASTSQCGLITNAAQTLKGDKTLQGKLIVSDSNTSATTKSSILQLTSSSNGNVGMEFWRGTNASWQIINSGGDLIFRNNYKDNAESAYNHQSLKLNYGTGAGSIPYLGINGEDTGYRLYVNGTTYIESDTSINSGALKFDSSPTSAPEASVPTALSLGRLQGYGTFAINADTDGTKTEYLVLTSGRGITSTTSHGLAIGYDTISWLGNSLWTKYLMKTVMIDASSLNVDTWYPVVIPLPYENCRIEIECSLNTNKPSWSTHDRGFTARKVWESNGSGWGTTSVIRRVLVSTYKFCDTDPIRGIGQLTNSSLEYVYVRGGGKYRFKVSANVTGTVELVTASKTWSSQSIAPTTTAPSTILCPYLYTTVQRGSAYRLAYYDSAQNLNSTGHYASSSQIGINITDIATIGDYALYTNGTSNFADTIYIRPCRGNYCEGLRIYQYGSWSDILLGGNDLTANTGTSANSWFIGNNNGTLNITRNGSSTGTAYLRCVSNKWYINTTSGAEQLNIGGWVGTVGNSGWYSITHGGGWYMNDANFIRNYGSKAVSINIADKNSWGIGTHRLAAVFKGTNHVSILLSTDTLGYGLCVNNNGNWYWGKRDSNSETATSKDTYLLQGNTTLVRPSTDMAIGLGQVKSAEFSNAYIRAINARHLDASGVYDEDMNLYIGYGSNSPTQKTSFYYSSGTHGAAATSRTQFAEINSNGLYALTRFGVNGQNTNYNFYVSGTSYFNGNVTHNGIVYFANGTTYYVNNSADTRLRYVGVGTAAPSTSYALNIGGNVYLNGVHYFANGTTYYINNSADAKLRYLALGGLTPTSTYQLYVEGQTKITNQVYTSWQANAGGSHIGWIKLMQIDLNTSNHFGNSIYHLDISRTYNSPSSEVYSVIVSVGWNNASITQIGGRAGSQIIDELRVVMDNTNHKAYVQMHVKESYTTYTNIVYINAITKYAGSSFTPINTVQTEAESAFSILNTITLSTSGEWAGNAYSATKLTSSAGSATNPVYFSSGKPVACTYSLKATLNSGTANLLPYYSSATAISQTGHFANTTQIGINTTSSSTVGSYNLYVNGSSYHNGALTFYGSDSYGIFTTRDNYGSIGATDKRFYRSYIYNMYGASLNLVDDANARYFNANADEDDGGGFFLYADWNQYGKLYVSAFGTASSSESEYGQVGVAQLVLGNSISVSNTLGSGANNAKGSIKLFSSGQYSTTIETISSTNNYSFILPNYAGHQYATHVGGTSAVGSSSKPVYVAANGRITSCGELSVMTAGARYVKASQTNPAYDHCLTFFSGQITVGTAAGNAYSGSSNKRTLWSFPAGQADEGTVANVQVLRLSWGTTYWHDIFANPNRFQLWYRNVVNGSAKAWKRIWIEGNSVTGAVWNDYAECRKADTQEPGYVMFEKGDDSLSKTIERLQHFAGIVSDTWGFSQGETADAKTNIAVAGRVLAHPYRDRNEYKPGDCVCAAPGGKVDIMTREEIAQYPDRIVGTVSCVPDYEEWGGGEGADRDPVKVDGRIWIKVR